MAAIELLEQLGACGVSVTVDRDELVLRPARNVPSDLLVQVKEHKAEILSRLQRRTELIDLPWPVGYGGLPADEVQSAESNNDRLGITDPVQRRLNVLSWMRCYYRDLGDIEMAQEMKEAYHELRHADPSIQAICGICQYEQQT